MEFIYKAGGYRASLEMEFIYKAFNTLCLHIKILKAA